ncbi:MAG TPA: hypothetical protein VEC35_11835 [Noviherbaspirillum sp.]|nr:hypothetical protein [Noviherbaspirillum sp.]
MNMRSAKRLRYARYRLAMANARPRSSPPDDLDEWLDAPAVGREFGADWARRQAVIDAIRRMQRPAGMSDETFKRWRVQGRK